MKTNNKDKHVHQEKPAARVTALDAVDLDSEIHRLLKEKLFQILHTISPTCAKWEPELETFLKIVLWKLSMGQSGVLATFGQQLLNLKYSRQLTAGRALAWAVLSILPSYLRLRTNEVVRLLVPPHLTDKAKKVASYIELLTETAFLVNLLVYLREGQFPGLQDRLLGVKPVAASTGSRVVAYHYMTRELLWHGFVELIVFILPLVNSKSVVRRAGQWLGLQKAGGGGKREALVYTAATKCAVCGEPPCLPHHMGCPHSFCCYCLQSSRQADPKFQCPSCGHSTEDASAVQPVTARICKL